MKIVNISLFFILILGANLCFGDGSVEFRLAHKESKQNTTEYKYNYQTIFVENEPSLVLFDLLRINVLIEDVNPPPWLQSLEKNPNITFPTKQIRLQVIFNDNGKYKFARITSENIGNMMAIFINNELSMAATIQDKIASGEAIITTGYTEKEAREFANRVNSQIKKEPT